MRRHTIWLALVMLITLQPGLIAAEDSGLTYPTIYHPLNMVYTPLEKKPSKYMNYIDLIFAPIGWSEDGKFAYIVEKDAGGAGRDEVGYFRWVILDMVTDKLLWVSKDELEKGIPKDLLSKEDVDMIFKWVFSNFLPRYKNQFDKYGIVINKNLKIQKFPLLYEGSEYRGSITDRFHETKYEIPNILSKYKIILSRDDAAQVFSKFNDQFLLDAQVVGYIKNPYEPRIAMVIGNIMWGWEGPPHPVYVSFVGCHLEKGF